VEIFGIGTDVIEIDRFGSLSDRFMVRCYSERERADLKGRHIEAIAGYFAAKEAIAKALGVGFVGFRPSAIEIVHNVAGKPEVVLYDGALVAAEAAGIKKIEISISHCKTYATAMAVAQK